MRRLLKNDPTVDQSLDDLQNDSNIYLLPDYEHVDDIEKAIEKYIKSKYARIFTHELSGWYLDPAPTRLESSHNYPGSH